MDIVGVPKADFAEVYPLVGWHFQSFADRSGGEITVDDLAGECVRGYRQCWLAWDGAVRAVALTTVDEGHKRVVEMTHCAGDGRADWDVALVEEIIAWAKRIGACHFRTINRPGYTKMLKSVGLRETHRVMEMDLGT